VLASAVAGFSSSLALIVAIGAQNAFVLRQGTRREHVWPVVATCATADALLIVVGVAGLGAALEANPAAVTAVRWAGAAFLLGYAALAARRALRPASLVAASAAGAASLRGTLLACLGFTFLNPHVYLDTVLLLGTVANQHRHQWVFAAGATLASAVWFTALGGGARRMAPLLARPLAWRVLDGLIAVVMAALAVGLLLAG
jgi:L-lysine exporter family protein LysE/ArgO